MLRMLYISVRRFINNIKDVFRFMQFVGSLAF